MKNIQESEFSSEVLNKRGVLVIVDFWAEWCGPCRVLGPSLEKIVDEIKSRGDMVELVKVNVDECQEVARKYEVFQIPTVKAFFNGKMLGEFVGVKENLEDFIRNFIEDMLKKAKSSDSSDVGEGEEEDDDYYEDDGWDDDWEYEDWEDGEDDGYDDEEGDEYGSDDGSWSDDDI